MGTTFLIKKDSIPKMMDLCWNLNLIMTIFEDDKEVKSVPFSIKYKANTDIGIITLAIKEQIQKSLNDYKMEQKLFNDIKLDAAIAELNNVVSVKEM